MRIAIRNVTPKQKEKLCKKYFGTKQKDCCDTDCPIYKLGAPFCILQLLDVEVEVDEKEN